MSLAVTARGLVYIYRLEGYDVVALAGVDLDIAPGESVALLGPSGSGKSTLLSLLAGLLTPSAGRLTVGEHDVAKAGETELQAMRASDVGVVLQGSARNLLPYLSVEQNVRFAQSGVTGDARRALPPPREVLSTVGLTVRGRYRARPGALTPAERQRLALAVALACRPGLLLADEPTSQLDSRSRDEVVSAFDSVRRTGTTVIVVTHDPEVGARMGRTVTIRDGRVGAEGHSGIDFSVIGRDGSVHLPPELLTRFPAGTLVHVQERPDGTIVLIPARHGALAGGNGAAGGPGRGGVAGDVRALPPVMGSPVMGSAVIGSPVIGSPVGSVTAAAAVAVSESSVLSSASGSGSASASAAAFGGAAGVTVSASVPLQRGFSADSASFNGSSADGSSFNGFSTERFSTEDSSTEGSSTQRSSTQRSSTEGSSTGGSSTGGSSTGGSSTERFSTERFSTERSSTERFERFRSDSSGSDGSSSDGPTIHRGEAS